LNIPKKSEHSRAFKDEDGTTLIQLIHIKTRKTAGQPMN